MQAARLPLQRKIGDPKAFGARSGQGRRSVSEKAPLQNQFSERTRIRWSSVEKHWPLDSLQMVKSCDSFRVKFGIGKSRVVRVPVLGDNRNDRAQNFAALRSGRLLFLFRRLGMKRASALHGVRLYCQRSKRTMI